MGWEGGGGKAGEGSEEREKMLRSTHQSVRLNGCGVFKPGQVRCEMGIRSSCCVASARAGRHCIRSCASTTEAATGPAQEGGDSCCACRWKGFGEFFTAAVEALNSQASNVDLVLFGGVAC